MKTRNTILVFALIALASLCFTACNNPIMKEWWDGGSSSAGEVDDNAPFQEGNFYTVRFNVNGGDPDSTPPEQFIAEGSKISPVSPPTKASDGFAGWYIDQAGNYQWYFDFPIEGDETIDGVLTLYAKWNPIAHTIQFDANGGIDFFKDAIPLRKQRIGEGGLLIEPAAGQKPGKGFAGWYDTDAGDTATGKMWNFNTPVDNDTPTTLYAKWDDPNCTVTFNANGGSTTPDPQTLAYNQTIREPEGITRVGYGFGGWYENESCTGTPWDFNRPVTKTAITLYARWVTNLYTVTFDAKGGSPAPAAQQVAHGNKINRPSEMFKEGEGFEGWYKEDTYSNAWDFQTDVAVKNTTLYAKWGNLEYTIKFDCLGGNPVPSEQRIGYQTQVVRPSVDPTKPADGGSQYGYVFKGWYTQATGTEADLYDFSTVVTGSRPNNTMTLYARYVPHNPLMSWIPGGTFTMGGLGGAGATTRPAHTVTVSGFYMLQVEMNQNAFHSMHWWKKYGNLSTYNFDNTTPATGVWAYNPSGAKGKYRPVEQVTWYDAVYYCNLATEYENKVTRKGINPYELPYIITGIKHANNQTGRAVPGNPTFEITELAYYDDIHKEGTVADSSPIVEATVRLNPKLIPGAGYHPEDVGYRLPTEAEWEYAARGGNGSPGNFLWAGSNTPNDVAWYGGGAGNTTVTQLPRLKAGNQFGLYDMSGNVCEWVWDKYDPDYYKSNYLPDNAKDPIGPGLPLGAGPATPSEERARRGGSIRHTADNCRTQVRDSDAADNTNWNIGFRLVRTELE